MIQGAGSNVGKSLLVAGLCRAAVHRGLSVAPFKPQNMSNNAAVTEDGGEIGRAQALQAMAARCPMSVDMNPVLLKPETDVGAQVVVRGQRLTTVRAGDYAKLRPRLLPMVLESFAKLRARHDLVIVEGAGSPAEINLRANDIANMGFARAADVPVVLAGDIDRGGVIAQILGTQLVLDPEDAAMIKGFVINKFRGDPALFTDGYKTIEERSGWTGFGVVPWFAQAHRLPAEDALDLGRGSHLTAAPSPAAPLKIVCLGLSRIANFDDLDPLAQEPAVHLTILRAGQVLPADTDIVIIPGSKSTRGDLAFLRAQGWDIDLGAHIRRGGHVLGICGGYQMLGREVHDPHGLEGSPGTDAGLGFLDIITEMTPDKRLTQVTAIHVPTDMPVTGYEIHIGRSAGPDRVRPFARIDGLDEGAISADGRVSGSYLHGMFGDDRFRTAWLRGFGQTSGVVNYSAEVDRTLDALAQHLETHMDLTGMFALAR